MINVIKIVKIKFILKSFHFYKKLFPKMYFYTENVKKNSREHIIYVNLLKAYIYSLDKIDGESENFIKELQKERLKIILRTTKKSAWWNSYLEKNNEGKHIYKEEKILNKLPPVTRLNLLDISGDKILTEKDNNSIIWRRTSGSTTGTPFTWGMDKTLLILNVISRFMKEFETLGFNVDENFNENFYFEFNYSPRSIRSEFRIFSSGDIFIKGSPQEKKEAIHDFCSRLEKISNPVIRISPGQIPVLLQHLAENNLKPSVSILSVVGQKLDENTRRAVKKHLGCNIIVHYGTQESGAIAIECKEKNGFYHPFPERNIVEIIDDHGNILTNNEEGNVTITCLDNTIMPLIKYQMGDIGILHKRKCECSNNFQTLEIISRKTDFIIINNVSKISPEIILKRFNVPPFIYSVRRIQIKQIMIGKIIINLEVKRHIKISDIDNQIKKLEGRNPGLKISVTQTELIKNEGEKFLTFIPLKKL